MTSKTPRVRKKATKARKKKSSKVRVAEIVRQDGWSNVLSNLGNIQKDWRMSTTFSRRSTFPVDQIEGLYSQDPIFARIIDAVAEHATRRWIKIEGSADESEEELDFGTAVQDALTDLDAPNKFAELIKFDRLYGGAVMLIGADDGRSMDQPLDLTRIRSLDHLNVLTRHEIFQGDLDMDPTSPNFRNPEWFMFEPQARNANLDTIRRIHHSRVICLKGILVNSHGRQSDEDWGEPVINRVYDAVRRFATIYDYTEALFKDVVQGVMKIDGLNALIKSDTGNELLVKRMQTINLAASAFNMILLDENESYERRTASFAGVGDIITQVMNETAAVAEMPLSILFGQPPTGLSTDDKAGRITFYDSIANKQRRLLRKPLKRVIEALLASKSGPTSGTVPERWSFDFCPLDEPSDNDRIGMRKTQAETDKIYLDAGALMAGEIRTRLKNDPNSPYVLDDKEFQEEIDAKNEMAKLGLEAAAAQTEDDSDGDPDQDDENGRDDE